MTIDELIERSHAMAVEKGWWPDGPEGRSVVEQVNNFHAEISEAWEEWRAGRMDLWWSLNGKEVIPTRTTHEAQNYEMAWRPAKPEGFWVEVADALLRNADMMGANGWKYRNTDCDSGDSDPVMIVKWIRKLANWLDDPTQDAWSGRAEWYANRIISYCLACADVCGVNLLELCELKMQYNATRPARHGGKRA